MTYEEYEEKKKSVEDKCRAIIDVLAREYAFSNAIAGVGDIITDSVHTIQVKKLELYHDYFMRRPTVKYIGVQLDKRTKERCKNQNDTEMFEKNILKINGKSVRR